MHSLGVRGTRGVRERSDTLVGIKQEGSKDPMVITLRYSHVMILNAFRGRYDRAQVHGWGCDGLLASRVVFSRNIDKMNHTYFPGRPDGSHLPR